MQGISIETKQIKSIVNELVKKHEDSLEEFLYNLVRKKPFGEHKFYAYCFLKNDPLLLGVKKYICQPRLTKPKPYPNTSLFRMNPRFPDEVEVMWILPNKEAMRNFKKGKIHENEIVQDSIHKYYSDRKSLWKPEPDDVTEEQFTEIYKGIQQTGMA